MKKLFVLAVLLSGLLAAGAYAWSDSGKFPSYLNGLSSERIPTYLSDLSGSSDAFPSYLNGLRSGSQVRAAIIYSSGDSVKIFAPDNTVLCEGDLIPVFRSAESMQSSDMNSMNRMISSANLSKMDLIGEVRVDSLEGDNYANGTLIIGEVGNGDIATKPSGECLSTEG